MKDEPVKDDVDAALAHFERLLRCGAITSDDEPHLRVLLAAAEASLVNPTPPPPPPPPPAAPPSDEIARLRQERDEALAWYKKTMRLYEDACARWNAAEAEAPRR